MKEGVGGGYDKGKQEGLLVQGRRLQRLASSSAQQELSVRSRGR